MNQFMSKKMSVDIYKVCWLFLHFIFDVIEWVVRLFYAVKRKLTVGNRRENLLDDNILIESAREYLTKIPSHLVIILGTESSPDFKILSKFIFWSLSAGIRNISFYDHKGILQAKNYKIFDCIARWKKESDKILWNANTNGISGSQIVYQNGQKKDLSVNFLSPADCKPKISEISRGLAADNQMSADQIDARLLDEKFANILNPDPDLAIYFGNVCCTYGLLPWHIRLTEFINVPSQSTLTANTFLYALCKYAKCEQRFGR